jgi:cell wall-associated NlpC family hydrolase
MASRLILLAVILTAMQLTGCSNTPKNTTSEAYQLPEAMPAEQARKKVVENAITQLGKPYKLSGNSPIEGFDCSGLVFYTHLHVGKLVPRRAEDQYLSAVKIKKVQPGDLVFFTTDSHGKHIDHVGIYIGHNKFIHAPGKGKVVTTSSLDEDYWKKNFIGAGNYWNY